MIEAFIVIVYINGARLVIDVPGRFLTEATCRAGITDYLTSHLKRARGIERTEGYCVIPGEDA